MFLSDINVALSSPLPLSLKIFKNSHKNIKNKMKTKSKKFSGENKKEIQNKISQVVILSC